MPETHNRSRGYVGLENTKEPTVVLGKMEKIWSREKDMGTSKKPGKCK